MSALSVPLQWQKVPPLRRWKLQLQKMVYYYHTLILVFGFIVLFTIVPSGYPQDIQNSSISSRTAIISWSPPEEHEQNGIVISYTVLVVKAGSEESFQLTSPDTSVTLTSLMPHSMYSISVSASTSVGPGPYSTTIMLHTLEDGKQKKHANNFFNTTLNIYFIVPTTSPVLHNGMALNPKTIHLSWSPPDEPNGVVREYRVTVTETNTGNVYSYVSFSTSIEITSLHPAYTYECSVAAFTIGLGPYSALFNVRNSSRWYVTIPVSSLSSYINLFLL